MNAGFTVLYSLLEMVAMHNAGIALFLCFINTKGLTSVNNNPILH